MRLTHRSLPSEGKELESSELANRAPAYTLLAGRQETETFPLTTAAGLEAGRPLRAPEIITTEIKENNSVRGAEGRCGEHANSTSKCKGPLYLL